MPAPRMPDRTDPTDCMTARLWAGVVDYMVLPTIAYWVLAFSGLSATVVSSCPPGSADSCAALGDGQFLLVDVNLLWAVGGVLAVFFGNLVVLQGAIGASLGKLLLDLRVVDSSLVVAGFGRCTVRTLLWIVPDGLGICVPLVGPITALVTDRHRRVGDIAAGTMVVRGRFAVPRDQRAALEAARRQREAERYGGERYGGGGGAPPPGGPDPTGGVGAAPLEPVWDPKLEAWVLWDPRRDSWMRNDPDTGVWEPFQPT